MKCPSLGGDCMSEDKEVREVEKVEDDPYYITTLPPKQQRFIHLYLTGRYKNAEIASLLGVHVATIYNWLRRPEIKQIINDFQRDEHEIVESNLKALRGKAIETMAELMDSPIDGIKYQASKDILDRTGHKAAQKMEVKKEVFNYERQMKEVLDNAISDEEIIELMEDEYRVDGE